VSSASGSVTHWIGRLKAGDAAAAQALWQGYYVRLVALARHKLRGAPRVVSDEEDVALSAFDSFCRAAGQGRFPRLDDRNDLWHLLVLLTARKAANLRKHARAQKRGGGRVRKVEPTHADESDILAELVGCEPSPQFAAEVAEECRRLLDALNDDPLRSIAVAKMEGYTNEEIADRLGVSLPTIERKLQRIRRIWE
jgi:DNA-directed RNA polymerase specialized sigma24 family protein